MEQLTFIDYLSYLLAVLMFVYLFKTVQGFHVQSVGKNKEAAGSLGVKTLRIQILAVLVSGALCGLGGSVLCMGQVTLFTENMSSGRGYIATVSYTHLDVYKRQALGKLAEDIVNPVEIPYEEIPNFLISTVKSHAGKLILGELCGKKVVCMSGRFHYYEGYDFEELLSLIHI